MADLSPLPQGLLGLTQDVVTSVFQNLSSCPPLPPSSLILTRLAFPYKAIPLTVWGTYNIHPPKQFREKDYMLVAMPEAQLLVHLSRWALLPAPALELGGVPPSPGPIWVPRSQSCLLTSARDLPRSPHLCIFWLWGPPVWRTQICAHPGSWSPLLNGSVYHKRPWASRAGIFLRTMGAGRFSRNQEHFRARREKGAGLAEKPEV